MRCAWILIALGACLGKTPEDHERDAVVEIGHHGPLHNPGSACLLCHGFSLGGTIYRRATDTEGLGGVTIAFTDAAGHQFQTVSNSAGNFWVQVETSLAAPSPGESPGQVGVPWDVEFPVLVEVIANGKTVKMRNQIGQWGSCAECHTPDPGARSNGRIYVEAP